MYLKFINDINVMKAISRVHQRAERQNDSEILRRTFVDFGIISDLENNNHQILYGRRGTGKTHILKYLESKLNQVENTFAIYIDARIFGSSTQYNMESDNLNRRCLALFRDFMSDVFNGLSNYVVNQLPDNAEKAFDECNELAEVLTEPVESITMNKVIVPEKHHKHKINNDLNTIFS